MATLVDHDPTMDSICSLHKVDIRGGRVRKTSEAHYGDRCTECSGGPRLLRPSASSIHRHHQVGWPPTDFQEGLSLLNIGECHRYRSRSRSRLYWDEEDCGGLRLRLALIVTIPLMSQSSSSVLLLTLLDIRIVCCFSYCSDCLLRSSICSLVNSGPLMRKPSRPCSGSADAVSGGS